MLKSQLFRGRGLVYEGKANFPGANHIERDVMQRSQTSRGKVYVRQERKLPGASHIYVYFHQKKKSR
jgi:hypothetical protein